jgi:FKBP-type peptidyl-prolyl cis-trans isomerase SlyD
MQPSSIQQGSVVSLSYVLTDPDGNEIDRSDSDEPFTYLHGYGQIVPGLEMALMGLSSGAKKQVIIPPSEGYGDLEQELRTVVQRDQLPNDATIEVGMRFMADQSDGESLVFTVVQVENDQIHLDGNHPLAGVTLHFDVEVLEVRPATAEEISHGHAHGPGGHHDH